ncbi:Hypothetical protein HDN1F_18940 [gamma proteobacterium HdN1]|nr:Hypothetical protein HDN1F_18940 [gamma proteobacterium HdN1]
MDTNTHYSAHLPLDLYTAEQVRELDRLAIASGVLGLTLMTRAGEAAFALLRERWPHAQRCVVVCGSGNNGGDGYVVARLAHEAGLQTTVIAVSEPEKLHGDARSAWELAQQAGVEIQPFSGAIPAADVLVDALLGTGLQGSLRDHARRAITAIRETRIPVLAIDIPSGLSADAGEPLGDAVHAAVTLTFIGIKLGLVLAQARAFVGELLFAGLFYDGLSLPEPFRRQQPPTARWITQAQVNTALPPRSRTAHKGHFGHVLVIGGDYGMGGAVLMAAEAAARMGAGLTTVATRLEHAPALLARRPEIMVHSAENAVGLQALVKSATTLVIGPGLGRNAWGKGLFQQVMVDGADRLAGKHIVIDADGLFWLEFFSRQPLLAINAQHWVLTPHPGEAARLLGSETSTVQQDRFAAVQKLHKKYQGVVVLKGAGTLILGREGGEHDVPHLASVGNPGMATGGMGDVLSGLIGGLLAQGKSLLDAARIGVWLHGAAADRVAAKYGERGLLATDLFEPLRALANPPVDPALPAEILPEAVLAEPSLPEPSILPESSSDESAP